MSVPLDRFAQERPALIATTGQTPFRLAVRHSRRVAEDYLVAGRPGADRAPPRTP